MRTKVISILAVVIVYWSAFIWAWANVPLAGETTNLQTGALVVVAVFGALGLILITYHTIKWLLNK